MKIGRFFLKLPARRCRSSTECRQDGVEDAKKRPISKSESEQKTGFEEAYGFESKSIKCGQEGDWSPTAESLISANIVDIRHCDD